MQKPKWYLSVLRERGRKGLPCTQLYRQMFNKDLYLLAYGNIYSNKGAMTPGAGEETADGMSEEKIEQITGLMRRERYRFARPAASTFRRRTGNSALSACRHGPINSSAKWSACSLRRTTSHGFSDRSHGFRKRRGCHTALREIHETWTGTTWFIEGDISDCFGSPGPRDPSRDTGGENP